MRRPFLSLVFAAALVLPGPAMASCKLALVLGLDISSSVNSREYDIQLQGLAHAFRTPEVIDAILAQPEGQWIAAIAYEWSGWAQQDLITAWTVLDSEAAVLGFAGTLSAHRRTYSDFPTAIGKAVEFGAGLFAGAPDCARRTIDLSGDGENNDGPGPTYFRDRGLLDGITVNGLVIQGAVPDPSHYYRRRVIQGPGAFVALARDFDDYPSVIVGKLLREIGTDLIVGSTN